MQRQMSRLRSLAQGQLLAVENCGQAALQPRGHKLCAEHRSIGSVIDRSGHQAKVECAIAGLLQQDAWR
jgi:hypothetical protein